MTDILTARTVKNVMFGAIVCELILPVYLDGNAHHLSRFIPVYYCLCALATAIILVCYRKTPEETRKTDEIKALTLSCVTAAYGLANIIAHLVVLTAGSIV